MKAFLARSPWSVALALVAVATFIARLAEPYLSEVDLVMVYLLAVVAGAGILPVRVATGCALFAVLAFDFFLVEPRYTLDVVDPRYLVTFLAMAVVGVVLSRQAERLRHGAKARADLEQATREARLNAETERMRSALLSSVSHDLRTPLSTVVAAASAMRTSPIRDNPEIVASFANEIYLESRRLGRLLDNLLHMTRVEGNVAAQTSWSLPEEVVAAAIEQSALDPDRVAVNIEPSQALAEFDPDLVLILLTNLLTNAAVHTPPDTPVEVTVRVTPDAMTLVVADQGPGFAGADPASLFDKFTRGPAAGPGTGIGLAICRAIAQAHGGTIRAVDTGHGARFEISLPNREAPAVE